MVSDYKCHYGTSVVPPTVYDPFSFTRIFADRLCNALVRRVTKYIRLPGNEEAVRIADRFKEKTYFRRLESLQPTFFKVILVKTQQLQLYFCSKIVDFRCN